MMMPQFAITDQRAFEQTRQPIKRKCVAVLRSVVDTADNTGAIDDNLIRDSRVQDAIYTLHAMRYKPDMIADFVARDRVTEKLVVRALGAAASRKLFAIIRGFQ